MPIKNRVVSCDICNESEIEKRFGEGWHGWSIIKGIGAKEPDGDKPIEMINLETHMCPEHTRILAQFITDMQEASKMFKEVS